MLFYTRNGMLSRFATGGRGIWIYCAVVAFSKKEIALIKHALSNIRRLTTESYLVEVVSADGNSTIQSRCSIENLTISASGEVRLITCENEEFNRASSLGLIDSKKIRDALFAFEIAAKEE